MRNQIPLSKFPRDSKENYFFIVGKLLLNSNFSTFSRAIPVADSRIKITEFSQLLQSHHSPLTPKRIHAQIITSGFHSHIFLNNILLSSYVKSSSIRDARQLFDKMPQRNLITWSSTISMYAQDNQGEEALFLFSCFRSSYSESPNEFILASVLRACTQLRSIGFAAQIHDLAIKTGFIMDIYVGTALIDCYSKSGDVEDAKSVFDELPVRSAVTWTAIITCYSRAGRSEISLQLFNQMRQTDIKPDRFVLSSVISACSVLGFHEGGKQIHGYVLRNGVEMDVSVNNVLIDFYSKCRGVRVARRVFDKMVVKNVVSWTTMIAGYMQNSCDFDAMKLFSEMYKSGWRPDGFTCTSILTSCGSLGALEEGRQVHSYIIKGYLACDEFVKNGLIDMYAKCDSLVDARQAFDVVVECNVVSYNAMIEGYARHGELSEALRLFSRMRFCSLPPSSLTFVSLLGMAAILYVIELSKQIHGLIIKVGVVLDLFAGSSLVDVYSKCSCVDDARMVFNEMDERDVVVWNAMIFGYTVNNQCEGALKLFLEMLFSRVRPNEFTFVALVTSASNLASFFHGLQFHTHIIKRCLDLDPYVSNALIDMYAKCGSINEARTLFDTMSGRDVVCWNSMISRYAQHGQAEEALNLFKGMHEEDIQPNYITFVGVLSACSHVGLVKEGLYHFNSMKHDFGIEPGMEHYACVVSLLGRFGRLREAMEFIEKMPIEPAAIVWRSLLSACQIVGDIELGKYAAEMAIATDPADSGSYVLLSNILAANSMWDDVENVRKGMNHSGVVKEPGHSWIEVGNQVHIFIVRDQSHYRADLIYSMLDGLTQHISGIGYIPDANILLVNE